MNRFYHWRYLVIQYNFVCVPDGGERPVTEVMSYCDAPGNVPGNSPFQVTGGLGLGGVSHCTIQ